MSKVSVNAQSKLGVLQLEALACDFCMQEALENYAVSWLEVKSLGPTTRKLMGHMPDLSHFCSQGCLVSYLTGKPLPPEATVG